ncbi:Gfo/Idh/MocA family oxidoreductase [Dyadobacter sp. LHD-138]|uniref:Gfo/Idh/MocA family protein n=1 Tax=Dyadobacter sp. LHD-138 TaxID=3071413 RepID=UPI0027E1B520|nr:Gfo/Idh/MocA family oxidoreductase [Dyadobacter sp. LHD-138]MDQ6480180.1 Gfo/Idh/MocA family oxidoreductase [Dyadobacter sp. LHD-138]
MQTASRRKFIETGLSALAGLSLVTHPGFGTTAKPADKIRLGIIGTGSRGAGLASLVKNIPALSLIACCDTIPANLKNGMAHAEKGAKAYTDYRQLLDDKNIDAVIIATPLYLHYPMAIAALQAGKHIYLEKSMTYDIPQAIDLVKQVHKSGLIFQVGYQYRYYSLYHRVKEIMKENWLGKITHFECQYNRNSNWRFPVSDPKLERAVNWRMYRAYCGGPLSELCAHEIDVVNFMLDSHPLKVVGLGGINYWKDGRDTYDNIRTVYDYPNGVKASVTSVLSNAYNGYSIRILGDKATAEILRDKAFIYPENINNAKGTVDGVTGATLALTTQGQGVELKFGKPGEAVPEPTITALQDFAHCIQTKKQPISNVETGRDGSIAIHMGNAAADTESVQLWKPAYSV